MRLLAELAAHGYTVPPPWIWATDRLANSPEFGLSRERRTRAAADPPTNRWRALTLLRSSLTIRDVAELLGAALLK
jgi:hypothetical protein